MRVMPRQALGLALVCIIFLSGEGYALKPVVAKTDKVYNLTEKIILKSDYESKDASYEWEVTYLPKGGFPTSLSEDEYLESGSLLFVWGKEGSYRAVVRATDFESKKVKKTTFTFSRGASTPTPPDPPVPPDPKPPTPPDPKPTPSPIPVDGFRVLIVYDYATLTALPQGQRDIRTGKAVRDFLKANCATDKYAEQDGKAYRIWPSTANPTAPGLESWKAAMARPRASLPWTIISNHPKGGYEGPLPENPDKMIELMKKYLNPSSTTSKEESTREVSPKELEDFAKDPYSKNKWNLKKLGTSLLVNSRGGI